LEKERSIVIIGAGISGLALGAYIKDAGFNCIILEKQNRVGGHIKSQIQDNAVLESGSSSTPDSIAFKQLVEILGLDQFLQTKVLAISLSVVLVKKRWTTLLTHILVVFALEMPIN